MKGLTDKQREVLEFIEKFQSEEGMAPTVYEIGNEFQIKTSTVFAHIQALKRKGFITRSSKARSIAIKKEVKGAIIKNSRMIEIPILGRVTAGLPVEAQEHQEGTVACDSNLINWERSKLFALKIHGESMRDLGILDGDVVIIQQTHNIRRGDIVVAIVDNETTVKSYYPASDARIELRPANKDFKSMFYPVEDVVIQGKVVSLQRQY
jgi:repressor LexA